MTEFACHRTYTGIYFLGKVESERHVDADTLENELDRVVSEFGFEPRKPDPGSVMRVWSRYRSKTAPELLELDGSEAQVILSLRVDTLSIGIRDLDNDSETVFVRELKSRIEGRLRSLYGVRKIPFERASDFLS